MDYNSCYLRSPYLDYSMHLWCTNGLLLYQTPKNGKICVYGWIIAYNSLLICRKWFWLFWNFLKQPCKLFSNLEQWYKIIIVIANMETIMNFILIRSKYIIFLKIYQTYCIKLVFQIFLFVFLHVNTEATFRLSIWVTCLLFLTLVFDPWQTSCGPLLLA